MTSFLKRDVDAIFVGTSAGGVTAIQRLLAKLPNDFDIPLIFVQHLPADSTIDPALIFSHHFRGEIIEALDKMPIQSHHAYFAPPGYHLSVERDSSFSLSQDEPVHFARPSIDVLFESVALSIGSKSCAVLLTGANSDGAVGLKAIHEAGGFTIAQDPSDAEAPTMPRSAIEIMKPDFVGNLDSIARVLMELTGNTAQ